MYATATVSILKFSSLGNVLANIVCSYNLIAITLKLILHWETHLTACNGQFWVIKFYKT